MCGSSATSAAFSTRRAGSASGSQSVAAAPEAQGWSCASRRRTIASAWCLPVEVQGGGHAQPACGQPLAAEQLLELALHPHHEVRRLDGEGRAGEGQALLAGVTRPGPARCSRAWPSARAPPPGGAARRRDFRWGCSRPGTAAARPAGHTAPGRARSRARRSMRGPRPRSRRQNGRSRWCSDTAPAAHPWH